MNTGARFCKLIVVGLIAASQFATNVHAQFINLNERPNIVLINLDDADASLLEQGFLDTFYPNMSEMARNGLRFSNMHATTPFCAPSRAALFRGQYAFNTGIKVNNADASNSNGFTGGYDEFVRRGHNESELGVWLRSSGYRTMHVGKFHHTNFDGVVPPGWDDFRISLGANYLGGIRFSNRENPDGQFVQTDESDYITTVDGDDAVELIQQQQDRPQPFFLYVAPLAPHAPSSFVPEDRVESRYLDFAANHSMPYSPDLFESDTSDKPRHFRFSLTTNNMNTVRRTYISRVRAMKSIDDMVGRIFDALRQINALGNTYVLLTSDNGFQTGHHNLQGKTDPYHRSTNVPLLVSGPGIANGRTANHLLAHIDLCPTILNLAQSAIPASVESKSFYPLLFSPDQFDEEQWQEGIMIENWARRRSFGRNLVGTYVAYRRHHEVFVSWANGEFEYYDLEQDPFQLNNAYEHLSTSEKQALKRLVRRFRTRSIDPITTIDKKYEKRFQNRNIKLRGYAEDDSGIHRTQVIVRSATTQRFWNGNSWQDEWFGHSVNPRNFNQPISVWNFKTRMETETESGHDFIVFSYRSFDSSNQFPPNVNFHINEVDSKPPVVDFGPVAQGIPVFDSNVTLNGTYFDGVEFDRATVTIRRGGTNQYFNGQGFQEGRFDLPTELFAENQWRLNVQLPAGFYIAGVKGVDTAGNRQHPANIMRFRVIP